jgi:hypothetical protein
VRFWKKKAGSFFEEDGKIVDGRNWRLEIGLVLKQARKRGDGRNRSLQTQDD